MNDPQLQEQDSSRSAVIDPSGGTIVLPGFAKVEFAPGSFDEAHRVTVMATNEPDERGLFKYSVGIGSVEHEIRVLTGETAPAEPTRVAAHVPKAFLQTVDSRRTPVIFARFTWRTRMHMNSEYELRESRFGLHDQTVEAEIPSSAFALHQSGRGIQAVIVIAAARLGPRDSSATKTIGASGGVVEVPLAWVEFDSAAFEEPHEVTVALTSHERDRDIFRLGYRYPPAAYEIRVLTGDAPPATAFDIGARIPDEYLEGLPEERIPDLYARIIAGGQSERHNKYYRLATDYDDETKVGRAEVHPAHFWHYRRGVGFEAVIMIGARLRD